MKVYITITATLLLTAILGGHGSSQDNGNDCLGGGCYLPPERGLFRCLASISRYFYNSTAQECQFFVYGGCQGTENNFETLDECQSACNNC
ncbi:Kunitz-type serine protease inhibitor 1 [Elysia marginata]|uniref:Kunitz-type serine protease inhibitor 1 n=1 Tax=Elysia marginata TaxID=1093978 RepID=A0AAV4FXA6_9GAST|nr:Kunitz-type serine protease inhibitor 1 [Elysia marginata]